MPPKHMSVEGYHVVMTSLAKQELRRLTKKALNYQRYGRVLPQELIDEIAELKAKIAKLKTGEFTAPVEVDESPDDNAG